MKRFMLTHENLSTIELMAEQLPGGFVIYQENENRDILFVNHALLDIYECSTLDEFRDLTGYTFDGMVHPEDRARVQDSIVMQIKGIEGNVDNVEYRILTRKGNVKWLDDYGHFNSSADFGDLYYVFLIDVTEKKMAQSAENKFFFDMSHEVLTPLNAVSTNLSLAKKHRQDPEQFDRYFEKAVEATDYLTHLVEKLLSIQRETFDMPYADLEESNGDAGDPPRILVAEDNLINQELIRIILEDAGFLPEIAENGCEAVKLVEDHGADYYSMVLMDIQMPSMDGYEAAERIRSLPLRGIENLPVYAVSANSRKEDKIRSEESGMNGHLSKPYDAEQIIEIIRRNLKHR